MEEEFFDFLKSDRTTQTFNYNDSKMIVNKVKYNDKLDILYALFNYRGELFDLSSPFKYSGIYDKEKNKLFDIEYSLRYDILNWDYNDYRIISSSELYRIISQDVNDKIEELISINKDDIFNIENVEIDKKIEDRDILQDFVDGKTSNTLENFYPKYSTEKPKNIFDYLTDKESLLEKESRDFITKNMTKILRGLFISRERRKVLKKIENNKNHPYHKIKNIIDAINNNNCVTVNLTINKNGIEQVFKYDAEVIKNYYRNSYLPTYGIVNVKDRRLFEENFDRDYDLHYEDIVKITYGKKVIYEDQNFINKSFEDDNVFER